MVNEVKKFTTLKFNRSGCEAITAAKVQVNQAIIVLFDVILRCYLITKKAKK